LKCVVDAKIWQTISLMLAKMRVEVAFKFREEGLDIRQMDSSRTIMVHLILPKEVWKEYTPLDRPILLDVQEMKKYLRSVKTAESIVLSADLGRESKLMMGVRGKYGFRNFGLAVMEPSEENKDPPVVRKFVSDVKVKVASQALAEAAADAKVVAGDEGFFAIEARSKPERFVVWAMEEGTFRSSWYDFHEDLSLMEMECNADKIRSAYGVPHIEVVLSGRALSNVVLIEYAEDFPAKFTYQLAFPGKLEFVIAPRVFKG